MYRVVETRKVKREGSGEQQPTPPTSELGMRGMEEAPGSTPTLGGAQGTVFQG